LLFFKKGNLSQNKYLIGKAFAFLFSGNLEIRILMQTYYLVL
jgi:hypothetical protein